jgi:hypothetical protein
MPRSSTRQLKSNVCWMLTIAVLTGVLVPNTTAPRHWPCTAQMGSTVTKPGVSAWVANVESVTNSTIRRRVIAMLCTTKQLGWNEANKWKAQPFRLLYMLARTSIYCVTYCCRLDDVPMLTYPPNTHNKYCIVRAISELITNTILQCQH